MRYTSWRRANCLAQFMLASLLSPVSYELNLDLVHGQGRAMPLLYLEYPFLSPLCSFTRLSPMFFGTQLKSPPQSHFMILKLSSLKVPWPPSFFMVNQPLNELYLCLFLSFYQEALSLSLVVVRSLDSSVKMSVLSSVCISSSGTLEESVNFSTY